MATKFTVAIIRKNKLKYGNDEIKTLTKEKLRTDITDFVELVEVNNDSLMVTVVDTIGMTPELLGNTQKCAETESGSYEMCYLSLKDNGMLDDVKDINGLSSYLGLDKVEIYNDTVLMKSEPTDNHTYRNVSITLDNIVDMLYDKFLHIGIRINVDGEIEEFTFTYDPMEAVDDPERWRWVEVPLLKFNLIMLIQLKPDSDIINKKATLLAGRYKIHGDVMVVSKSTESSYTNTDKELLAKLFMVSYGTIKNRELTEDEKKDEQKDDDPDNIDNTDKPDNTVDGLPIYISRYVILNNRLITCQNTITLCAYCAKAGDDLKACTGCYRIKYCSTECHTKHWEDHKSDCLHSVVPIHVNAQ